MTHAELVNRAVHWLRAQGCWVVVTSGSVHCLEIPDALGWTGRGWSTLVEAKSSRADFLRDRKKPCRLLVGMGNERWYLTPPGLVAPADLPAGWGLLECHPRLIRQVSLAPRRTTKGAAEELRVLISQMTRQSLDPTCWVGDEGMGV